MNVKTERRGEALVAEVEGRIDGVTAREFEAIMTAAIGDDDRAVVVDCASLSYISSAGLRALLMVAKSQWNRDAAFAVCSLDDPIREVFEISGFDKIIEVHASLADALEPAAG